MPDLTISLSGVIDPAALSLLENVTITGPGVTVTTPNGLGADLLDNFTVENGAIFELNNSLDVNALDSFHIGSNGTLDLVNGLGASVLTNISFASGASGGDLIVNDGATISAFSGISGFNYGDAIDFTGAGTPTTGSVTTSAALLGGTNFTVTTSTGTQTFELAGNYTHDTFAATPDGNGGFKMLDDTPCFAQGTRILTLEGEVPVEQLSIGDVIVLNNGGTSPVIFIGRRRVNLSRHRRPETARPIRICANALEPGVPSRDLLVSPDHALFIDGVLIPARDLVDGLMIRQDHAMSAVTYYHVELAEHAILLAEGAAAETFLNVGHRGVFENSSDPVILHPDFWSAEREQLSCAPLVTEGPQLAAIRSRLHAYARAQGYAVSEQPRMALELNGTQLVAHDAGGGWQTFTIPENTTEAVLTSPLFRPAETDPASLDRRTLGIALAGLMLNGNYVPVEDIISPEHLHARGAGESAVWTNGPACMKFPAGAKSISLLIAAWPRCWQVIPHAA